MEDSIEYAQARAQVLENLWKELEEQSPEDIYEWATSKIIQVKGCSKEEAEKILREIIEGIDIYRKLETSQEEYIQKLTEKLSEEEKKELDSLIDDIAEKILLSAEQGQEEYTQKLEEDITYEDKKDNVIQEKDEK
ncbi:MAG: hypothetical protein RMJ38_00980 [candidate division WOR-3 bacterium]|nr:hypothetical protein [candidate division WOR-3 bacterium]MDW8150003.1 hypothetical protein [candidate division WOR-3 bacterium]